MVVTAAFLPLLHSSLPERATLYVGFPLQVKEKVPAKIPTSPNDPEG